jgi:hypothetical protein
MADIYSLFFFLKFLCLFILRLFYFLLRKTFFLILSVPMASYHGYLWCEIPCLRPNLKIKVADRELKLLSNENILGVNTTAFE